MAASARLLTKALKRQGMLERSIAKRITKNPNRNVAHMDVTEALNKNLRVVLVLLFPINPVKTAISPAAVVRDTGIAILDPVLITASSSSSSSPSPAAAAATSSSCSSSSSAAATASSSSPSASRSSPPPPSPAAAAASYSSSKYGIAGPASISPPPPPPPSSSSSSSVPSSIYGIPGPGSTSPPGCRGSVVTAAAAAVPLPLEQKNFNGTISWHY